LTIFYNIAFFKINYLKNAYFKCIRIIYLIIITLYLIYEKYGDWGLGIGDWGLGIGDWAPSPKPHPQNPKPQKKILKKINYKF